MDSGGEGKCVTTGARDCLEGVRGDIVVGQGGAKKLNEEELEKMLEKCICDVLEV